MKAKSIVQSSVDGSGALILEAHIDFTDVQFFAKAANSAYIPTDTEAKAALLVAENQLRDKFRELAMLHVVRAYREAQKARERQANQ